MSDAPIRTLLFFHTALSHDLAGIAELIARGSLAEASERFDVFRSMADLHKHVEEQGLFPSIAGQVTYDTGPLLREHQDEETLLGELGTALAEGGDARAAVQALQGHLHAHIEEENGTLFPAIERALDSAAQVSAVQAVQAQVPQHSNATLLPWMVRSLPTDEAIRYARGLGEKMPPPAFAMVRQWWEAEVPQDRLASLREHVPQLRG